MSDDARPGRWTSASPKASAASAGTRSRSRVGKAARIRSRPSMRQWLALPVLLGPAALAFAKGGYFDVPRLTAGAVACAMVVVAAFTAPEPLPRERPARLALAGLAALTAWTAASLAWAPIAGVTADDLQRLILYLATFTAALALLRPPEAQRLVEPVLLAGIVACAAYGLSERLLPGVFDLETLPSADDRLAWPLTYWNAMGALAGIGLVLGAAIPSRLALATAPVLGLALYLTFSRGAIGATAVGLALLLALDPTRGQTRQLAIVCGAAVLAAAGAIVFDDGPALLVIVGALAAATAALGGPRDATPVRALRTGALAALGLALVATALAMTLTERRPVQGASPERLASVQSNRFEYWRVAVNTFAEHPLQGAGSGSFRTEWLRERPIPESVRDAHSLYLETAAELGIVGLRRTRAVPRRRRRHGTPRPRAGRRRGARALRRARCNRLGLGDAGAHALRAGTRRLISGRSTSRQLSVASSTEPASANTGHSTYGWMYSSHSPSPQRASSESTSRW